MPKYEVKTIKDRVAYGDDIYLATAYDNGTILLTPDPNEIIEEGTMVNANLLQNYENLCGAVATEINGGDSTSNTSTTYTDNVIPSDKISTTLKMRQDTQANFNSNNPVLSQGEVALDTTNFVLHFGNGSDGYNALQKYVAIGNAYASSSWTALALGYGSSASGSNSTALGRGAYASGSNSTALGYNVSASGNYATALGYNASASGDYATALGRGAYASGNSATALGYSASASGNSATALGRGAYASGSNSTALGYSAYASGDYAIKVGFGTASGTSYYVSGNYSIGIGYNSRTSYNYCTLLGYGTSSSYAYSTAIGYNASPDSSYTIQLGGSSNSYVHYYGTLEQRSDERDKFDMRPFDDTTILNFLTSLKTFDYLRNPRGLYEYTELDENGEEIYTDPNHDKYGLGAYDHEAHDRGDKAGSRRRSGVSAQDVQEKMAEFFGKDYNLNLVNDNLFDRVADGEEIPEGVESQLEVSYVSFIPLLISAIKALKEEIEELKNE